MFIFLYKEFYNNNPALWIYFLNLHWKIKSKHILWRDVSLDLVFVCENESTGQVSVVLVCSAFSVVANHWNKFSFQNILLFFFSFALRPQECHFTVLSRGGATWSHWIIKMLSLELPPLRLYNKYVYHVVKYNFFSLYMKLGFHTHCILFTFVSHLLYVSEISYCRLHDQ